VYSYNRGAEKESWKPDRLEGIQAAVDCNMLEDELDLMMLCLSEIKSSVTMHNDENCTRPIISFMDRFIVQRTSIAIKLN
jgi:hypothetical protein